MGLIEATWRFQGAAPDPRTVAEKLAAQTGLAVDWDGEAMSALSERLFVACAGETMTVSGFVPAHPYLWENLDAVLTLSGGERLPATVGWRPTRHELRRPWRDLDRRTRLVLRLPTLGASRPFDRWL